MKGQVKKYSYLPYIILIQSLVMLICILSIDTNGNEGGLNAVSLVFRLLVIVVILVLVWIVLFIIRRLIPALSTFERKEKVKAALTLYPFIIPISYLLTFVVLISFEAIDDQMYRFRESNWNKERSEYMLNLAEDNPTYRFDSEKQFGLGYYTPSGYFALADIMSAKGPIHIKLEYPDTMKFPNHEFAVKMMWEAGSIFLKANSKTLVKNNIRLKKYEIKKDPEYDTYRIYFNPGEKNEIVIRYDVYEALIALDAGTHTAPDY